ncbi:hypothetical protein OUZ56_001691 [Daphnia magna]|uniref:Elongation of very long chain fatty acids protein n=1 Tax=Daphnia magna TaxID=35525 RepID=A0ABR0A3F1_9CRUS|nr:hypothetical protein OUZ56_001691 [Daphnia magna]
MASVIQTVVDKSIRIWDQRDRRTDGWFLTENPQTPVLICLAYLFVVKILGPKLMKNRPAFELRGALMVYNAFQIVFNGWMFYHICRLTWFNGYSFICQPVDYSDNEDALELIKMGYCFYISKFIDFLDTLFFIMRRKDNQITFLHVFHHASIPLTVWIVFRFIPGGQATFLPTFNSLVHFIMYFYYLMAAMGPRVQKYLWWKKYLTVFQMVQFFLVGLHGLQLLFIECNFPTAFSWYALVQTVFFFQLFKNFHSKAYKPKQNINNNNNNNDLKKIK